MGSNSSFAPDKLHMQVEDICKDMGFSFSQDIFAGITTYLSLLLRWNKVMNLVGKHDPEDILRLLLVDSFYLAEFMESLPSQNSMEIWDLGAGAGLPGIALRMLWQQGVYTMVEPRDKRAGFLQTVLVAYPLPRVQVFRGRAEVFMPTRPKADMVISRAFLPWEKVLELVAPYMSQKGLCVFLTLQPLPEVFPLSWSAFAQKKYSVGNDSRWFWAIQRVEE